jgi:hypothetical protein
MCTLNSSPIRGLSLTFAAERASMSGDSGVVSVMV